MKTTKTTQLLTAAALAVGGLAFVAGCDNTDSTKTTTETKTTETRTTTANPNASTPGDKVESAMDKTGDAIKSAADKTGNAVNTAVDKTGAAMKNVGNDLRSSVHGTTVSSSAGSSDTDQVNGAREQVSEIVEAALTENGIDNIGRRLSDEDQKRLHDLRAQNTDDLKKVVESIQKKWKDKYNHSFDMDAKVALNDSFMTLGGATPGDARTAGAHVGTTDTHANVSVNNNTSPAGDKATTGAPSSAENASNASHSDRVTANIPASHGLPALSLNLVKQDSSWKLDIPDTLNEQKLHDNLLNHLRMVDADAANWPADQNEAFRVVSHHILMALSDQPAGAASAAPTTP